MKIAVVKLSDISTACLSAKRFVGECATCNRVKICRLDEAKEGRIEMLSRKISAKQAELLKLNKRLQKERDKL